MTDTWRLTRPSEYGADGYTCTACGREGWFEKHPPRCVCQPTAEQLEVALAEEREKVATLEAHIRELTEPPAIGQLWKVLSSGRVYRIVGNTNDGRDLELLFDPSMEVPIGTRAWVPHSWFAPGVVRHVPSTEGGEG